MNEKLLDYIRGNLDKGFTLKAIIKKLKKAGYSSSVIKSAINAIKLEQKNKELQTYISQVNFDEVGMTTIDDKVHREVARQNKRLLWTFLNIFIIAIFLVGGLVIYLSADSKTSFVIKDIGGDKAGDAGGPSCDDISIAVVKLKGEEQLCYFNSEGKNLKLIIMNTGKSNVNSLNIMVGGSNDLLKIVENKKIAPGKILAKLYDYDFEHYGSIYRVEIVPSLKTINGLVYCKNQGLVVEDVGEC